MVHSAAWANPVVLSPDPKGVVEPLLVLIYVHIRDCMTIIRVAKGLNIMFMFHFIQNEVPPQGY